MISLEEFSSLVADIYDAAVDPTLWDRTMERILSVSGGANGGLVLYDRQKRRRPRIIAAPTFDSAQVREYTEYYSQLDPHAPIREQSPAGVIVTGRALVTESQLRGEFYTDWAYPNETGDSIYVNLLDDASGVCTFIIAHPWRSDPFVTPDVLRLVSLLVPHLQRAIQIQSGPGSLNWARDGALDLVDHWRHGFVLVSRTGQTLYVNQAARGMAAAQDGLSLGRLGLQATSTPENARLQRLIHRACDANGHEPRPSGRLAISRPSGRKSYTIQVLPLHESRTFLIESASAALVLIIDHEREIHIRSADLRDLYDLTPAEAEVAIRVLDGHGLQSVADVLGVALSTVRTHLQRAFEKTGTHRQAELVRLLTEL